MGRVTPPTNAPPSGLTRQANEKKKKQTVDKVLDVIINFI